MIEDEKIQEAAKILKAGGIVVFPTETVYGIGANAFCEQAVERIYKVKQRPKEKPLSVLISDVSMVDELAIDVSQEERKVMEKFFPGPLTIVLKKSPKIPEIVTASKDTIGVRMPENEIALKLIEKARKSISNT
ncbi:MAG: threonylcarbamoyl-AMP synthase [Clostridia bacterium]|nr:threonylcarbamoyl-AMP synthase [Clostridia bacterium]